MERNKNKIIHIFQTEGTLTPPGKGMVMNSGFEEWFLDWSLANDYCLLTYGDVKDCRTHIPHTILNKAKYVFSHEGKEVNRYRGANWIKKIGDIETFKNSGSIIDYLLDTEEYGRCFLYSHHCHTNDSALADRLQGMHRCSVYSISEWKDTVLFLKQQIWDKTSA
jgi:hypothetical protein